MRIRLQEEQVTEILTAQGANDWALSMISIVTASKLKEIHVGFDCEWNRGSPGITRTLALSFPEGIGSTSAVLINLSKMGIRTSDSFHQFPHKLQSLLEMEKIVPVGVHTGVDVKRLADLGVKIT